MTLWPADWLTGGALHRRIASALPQHAALQNALGATLILVLLWFGLGSYSLFDNNEGLYAAVARDMLLRQDWISPHLNGVAYPEKPPLFYYLLTAAFAIFGANEWSARGVSATAATACLGFVYWAALRLIGRTPARLATLVLVSSVGFVMLARAVMPDMLLIATFSTALIGSYVAWQRRSVTGYAWCLAALACAVLTKGLLPLALFLGVWVLFVATGWRSPDGAARSAVRFIAKPIPWLVFILLALPWHVAAMLRDDQFFWFYFMNEHVLRFLGTRIPADTYSGSVLYYLPRIVLLFFPWVLLLPTALHSPRPAETRHFERFTGIATVLIIAFFTVASAKANYYVALALPFAALWLATRIAGRGSEPPPSWTLGLLGGTTIAMLLAGMWAVSLEVRWTTIVQRWNWDGVYVSIGLIVLALVTMLLVWRNTLSRWLLPAAATLVLLAFALGVARLHEVKLSARKLVDATRARCPSCTMMLYRDYESLSAVGFYAGQTVVPVIDSESNDLWWGQLKSPRADTFVTSLDVFERSSAGESIAVFLTRRQRKEFLASPLGGDARRIERRGGAASYLLQPAGKVEADFFPPLP
jgi:4-amino-4-deoxy-L-arabinose transferase-like glycosyltransferase